MNPTAHLLRPEVEELIREQRFAELHDTLHLVPPADVAEIVADLDPVDSAVAFRFLPRDHAGEVFSYLPPEKQEELIKHLGAEASLRLVEGMTPDDRAKLLDELPTEAAQRLIASLSPEERRATQAILGYPPKSVGRLMTPDYIAIRPEWTIARVLEEIRRKGRDAEIINVVYVVDERGTLIDDMRLRQLLLADPNQSVESVMNRTFIALRADQPQEEAVRTMAKYDRVALPVVDSRGVLLGIVTYDDVADVAEAEATEDMQKMGGLEALDAPYMSTSLLTLVRKRSTWLAVLFVGEMFTQTAMAGFEDELHKRAVLATFVPLIVSSGGNSGSQATSLIIRALAVGEITLKDWWRVMRREIAAGALLGAILGVIGLVRVNVWGALRWFKHDTEVQEHYHLLATTIGVAVVGVVLWGTIVGAMLPFGLKKVGLDPATSSAPFVATLVDVIGVLVYLTTAVLILRGTLL
ncbi:MAG TPA: magnesium transporter [Phycisphaerales bacterium]|nr:magnesium transporter [Phycisphaerales bacterium]